jgi:hypothetical protein
VASFLSGLSRKKDKYKKKAEQVKKWRLDQLTTKKVHASENFPQSAHKKQRTRK